MDWQLRKATKGDTGRLALIGAATFLETFAGILDGGAIVLHCRKEHSEDAYIRYLERGAAWLAETAQGGAPVGFALLGAVDLPGSSPEGDIELKRIYALSRFHGTGIGMELLGRGIKCARSQRAKRLLLGVYAGNKRAIAFYRKHGFNQIATRQFLVDDRKYDDIVFAKML